MFIDSEKFSEKHYNLHNITDLSRRLKNYCKQFYYAIHSAWGYVASETEGKFVILHYIYTYVNIDERMKRNFFSPCSIATNNQT